MDGIGSCSENPVFPQEKRRVLIIFQSRELWQLNVIFIDAVDKLVGILLLTNENRHSVLGSFFLLDCTFLYTYLLCWADACPSLPNAVRLGAVACGMEPSLLVFFISSCVFDHRTNGSL